MNRIRIQFSIEWYGQNKVPYGPKHGLYRKNLCQTLFRHETSFPSSKIHQSGTIWIGKPFSIDLNDQKQVPDGQNEALQRFLCKIFEKNSKKIEEKKSLVFPGVFRVVWSCRGRVSGDSGPKNIENNFWTKKCFFRPKEATGLARAGKINRPSPAGLPVTGLPARPGRTEFPFYGSY